MSSERDILPGYVKPIHYDLKLSKIDVKNNTFEGEVAIQLEIKEDTNKIILHASNLEFKKTIVNYSVAKTESNIKVESIEFDGKKELVTIHLNETLRADPSAKLLLTIIYTGEIKTNMEGFYRSDYKDINGEDQIALSTQFEATTARVTFPSFDEPNLKATFQLSLTIAEDFTALSNTPILSSKVLDDGKKKGSIEAHGLKTVIFEKTVIQSTYLFAWAIGKLDYIETFTDRLYNGKRLPVRVYTQEGISEQGKFGLEVAKKAIDILSEIFEIDYVLSKIDLISIPSYSHNAMENWGLITFRPTALLYDPKTSSEEYKLKVCYVICHELAHQWFGNLVTMDWWDELWLNEGFATWVGYYVADLIYPEWKVFETQIFQGQQTALIADSVRSSHPVEVPIKSSSDIDQVFDHISYLKGGSVIHQFAKTLGVKTFLKGVSHYLNKNKFANGTTNDLLSSISEVSGQSVLSIAEDWIRKIGFPYVEVQSLENGDVKFIQKRFLSAGDATNEENTTVWSIPLNISTGFKPEDLNTQTLNEKELIVPKLSESFFKVNKDNVGFFRVVYDDKSGELIQQNISKLSNVDKAGLINDSFITSIAGLSKTSRFLSLLQHFKGESEYIVLSSLIQNLKNFSSLWYGVSERVQTGLKQYFKDIISSAALSVLDIEKPKDFLAITLRNELLSAGVSFGIDDITNKGKSLFDKLIKAENIDPSLRFFILSSTISSSDATEDQFNSILEYIKASTSLDAREIGLTALSSVSNPTLILRALELILSEDIPIMDVQFIANGLSKNSKAKIAFWEYLAANYDAIYTRLNVNRVVFDRFIKFTLGRYSDSTLYTTIEQFFKDKDIYGFERSLYQVLDQIKTNSAWVERDDNDVEEWLQEHNYI
ncbi:hypothetical protein WICMUC_005086 [Wickerhamomyces mucosus]|uniref:Aminopeptidase n=1 Tax=Wickerhamomyces mucosus TaxID=1378264 RepID=A0A9P8PBV1_9ASCO|nr:hypothetical protein WICMUC_005086 [Wickerhamomyces mucosus]